MDDNTESAIIAVAICASITAALYFVVVVWWAGMVDRWHKEEMARHANCYQRWAFNEAHQVRYLVESYCGEGAVEVDHDPR